jgi:hypothetical protein
MLGGSYRLFEVSPLWDNTPCLHSSHRGHTTGKQNKGSNRGRRVSLFWLDAQRRPLKRGSEMDTGTTTLDGSPGAFKEQSDNMCTR